MPSDSGTSSRTAGRLPLPRLVAELAVVLSLRYGIMAADLLGWLPQGLEILPGVGLAWIYFVLAAAVLVLARRRGERWPATGLSRPERVRATLGLALAGVLAAFILDGLTQTFLEAAFGAGQDLSGFRDLVGRPARLARLLAAAWLFAAWGEEVFFRGWLMARLDALLGRRNGRATLLLQAALFGAVHASQGPAGAVSAGLYGLVYGLLVRRARGSLWAAILAHGLIDTVGLVAIYAGALPV